MLLLKGVLAMLAPCIVAGFPATAGVTAIVDTFAVVGDLAVHVYVYVTLRSCAERKHTK
jgi:hypothetical protein